MNRPLAIIALFLSCCSLEAASNEWPGFRGPNLDGAVRDARLFAGDAPALTVGWKVVLGSGYSAPIVGGGRVYAMFAEGDADVLGAFDAQSGARLWTYRIADAYKGHDGSHDGPISTPTLHDGRVYGLGPRGQLFAVDATSGEQIWKIHLKDDVGADKPWYGFTSSPLVVDGTVVVELSEAALDEEEAAHAEEEKEEPKPRKPMAVAGLDATTGAVRWIAGDDTIEYHSPVVGTLGGKRQLLVAGKDRIYGLEPSSGAVLWSYEHTGDNRAMGGLSIVPVPAGNDRVFLMNNLDSSVMLQVRRDGGDWKIEPLWSSGGIARSYVVPVYHEGHLYGMNNRIFSCIDAATGELAWRSREPGDGFPTLVGRHIVMMTKAGSLHVVDASPAAYREVASLDLFGENSWSEVAFAGGHLFARSMGHLARVDLNAAAGGEAGGDSWFDRTLLGRFLVELQAAPDKAAAIDGFLALHPKSPLVDDDGIAHFIYRGPAEDVGIVGDVIGFRREDPMIRVPGTDLFHYTARLEPTAAATYGFIVDYADPAPDPRNPNAANGLFGDVSWFAMPAWRAPTFLGEAPAGKRGRLETLEWTSALLESAKRTAQVYLPAGYDVGDGRYPVVYVHFGDAALEQGRMTHALDNLIGSRVAPLIAVFVQAGEADATADVRNPKYKEMIFTELVPAVDERFRTVPEPRARATVGFGRSAAVAATLAFEHPEIFGRAGMQSALMGTDSIPDLTERGADVRPLVLYMDWGTYHMRSPHEAWSLTEENRKLWAALREAGYRPAGGERPEGFGWPMWSAHADELLAALFPLTF